MLDTGSPCHPLHVIIQPLFMRLPAVRCGERDVMQRVLLNWFGWYRNWM